MLTRGARVIGVAAAEAGKPFWIEKPAAGANSIVVHALLDSKSTTAAYRFTIRPGDTTVFGPTGRLEEGQRLVLLDQIKSWCADSRTKDTVKPVIDLADQMDRELEIRNGHLVTF